MFQTVWVEQLVVLLLAVCSVLGALLLEAASGFWAGSTKARSKPGRMASRSASMGRASSGPGMRRREWRLEIWGSAGRQSALRCRLENPYIQAMTQARYGAQNASNQMLMQSLGQLGMAGGALAHPGGQGQGGVGGNQNLMALLQMFLAGQNGGGYSGGGGY